MERKLAAILAADVVGYSALMERDEAGTFARLKFLRTEIVEPEMANRHGRIFKLMGDGLLAEFASVVEAIECAVAVQMHLARYNVAAGPEERIDLRIGINLGDVMAEGSDLYGDGVNIAARLEQLAEPGGICVSRAAYDHAQKKLPYKFEAMGDQKLKNITEPIAVFRVNATEIASRPIARVPRRNAIVGLVGGLAAVAIAAFAIWHGTGDKGPDQSSFSRSSIAVLPFANLGSDEKWQRFADGVTEDVISDLSRSREIFVIAQFDGCLQRQIYRCP